MHPIRADASAPRTNFHQRGHMPLGLMKKDWSDNMTFQDLGFGHRYKCAILPGLPGDGPKPHLFSLRGQAFYSEGLVVRVDPEGALPWIGNFQEGDEGLSGAFGYPLDTSVLVVARGQGYIVPTRRPDRYELVKSYPIREVRRVPGLPLILLADYTQLSAYGRDGLVWTTARLSWDGLKIHQVTDRWISGLAWDAPDSAEVAFRVNVQTGQSEGGSSPNS